MKAIKEYQFIFHGAWEKIQDEFRSTYRKKGKFPKTELENIASNLKPIFHRCGFELKTSEKRLWVESHEINCKEANKLPAAPARH